MIFMLAAVWPDDIRSDRNYSEENDTVTGPRAGRKSVTATSSVTSTGILWIIRFRMIRRLCRPLLP